MFNLDSYKQFVQSQIINRISYYSSDTTDIYLEALYQFTTEPKNILTNIHPTTISKKYKAIFGPIDKPISVSYNYWFLFKFGYKYCNSCNNVLCISSFNKDKNTWSQLHVLCKNCHKEKTKKYNNANPEKVAYTQSRYKQINREKFVTYNRSYRLAHLAEDAARSMKRYTSKKQAAPMWLTKDQYLQILDFYKLAKELTLATGIAHQVDHIVPIQGNNVCGLHVPWNLQVITALENRKKSNKLISKI